MEAELCIFSAHYIRLLDINEERVKIKSEIPSGSLVAAYFQKEWRRALVLKKVGRSKYKASPSPQYSSCSVHSAEFFFNHI